MSSGASRKSPLPAGCLSLIIPGAGFVYLGGWWIPVGVGVFLMYVVVSIMGLGRLGSLGRFVESCGFYIAQVAGAVVATFTRNALISAHERIQAERARIQAEREQFEAAVRRGEEQYRGLVRIVDKASNLERKMLPIIDSPDKAQSHLAEAESFYKQHAYGLMYDSFTRAAQVLANATSNLDLIRNDYKRHMAWFRDVLPSVVSTPILSEKGLRIPSFPPPPEPPQDLGSRIANVEAKMKRIFMMAQTNVQCTQIWEQKKMQGILISGFSGLQEAVYNLRDALDYQCSQFRDFSVTVHCDLQAIQSEIEAANRDAELRSVRSEESATKRHAAQQSSMKDIKRGIDEMVDRSR